MKRRAADHFKEFTAGWNHSVLVSDGFSGYNKALKDESGVRHARCITHARRSFFGALDLPALTEACAGDTTQELLHRKIDNDSTDIMFVHIIDLIDRMYEWERTLVRRVNESDESFFARVHECRQKHERPLFEKIEAVIEQLQPTYAKFEGGRWVSTSNTNRMAATVVEWLNAVDNLRTFLDDPRTPLDSNAVERQLRVVTVLRKICGIKQTVEFAERFADML